MSQSRIERMILVGILLLVFAFAGCTRGFYRRQADRDAYCLIESHSNDPRWHLEDYCLTPSPASRMFDPANPDCEPMPPDDPASHEYMHCVDCKKGWPCWQRYGKTPFVTNPRWRSCLPLDREGNLALDRQAAVQMGLLNSRDYQQQLENLYISALEVSLQRFRFDVQFFGTSGTGNANNATAFTLSSPTVRGAPVNTGLESDTSLGARRMLATGGQLVVDAANSVVWQFSGSEQSFTTTLLNFSFLQPLLRGGGRAVALEALTQSERNLLANIRQMERYRQGFYTEIVTGRDSGPGPSPLGIAIGSLVPGGPAGIGGFLGLLQAQVQIRNQRSNVSGLQSSLEQLQAFYEAGRLVRFQVDLARQSVYDAQSRLLTIVTSYEDALDDFKINLGLPPDLKVRIADPLLERFDLISPDLTSAQDAVVELTRMVGDETVPLPENYLEQASSFQQRVQQEVERVQRDLADLKAALPERRKILRQLATREEIRAGQVEPGVVDPLVLEGRVKRVSEEFTGLLPKIAATLEELRQFVQHPPSPSQIAPKPPAPPAPATQGNPPPGNPNLATPGTPSGAGAGMPPGLQLDLPSTPQTKEAPDSPREQLAAILAALGGHLRVLSLLQAAARLDTVTLVPIELDPEKAFEIARENRLDWMNARAALVDDWRQIEIRANALRSGLNLLVSGNVTNVSNNSTTVPATSSNLRVGFEFEAPLNRMTERNNYVQTLIAYQQARRQYYAYEDLVNRGLRRTLRQLQLNQLDFELRRTAVFNAISQVESAQSGLERPPKPGETAQLSPTTARDLTQAISSLLSAQNTFLSIWVAYEAERMFLDMDMGTMQLDAHGMWIDPGPITGEGPPSGRRREGAAPAQPEEIPAGTPADVFAPPPQPGR